MTDPLLAMSLRPGLLPAERAALEAQMEYFDEADDCRGYDGRCGGCGACCNMQASYYAHQEAERRIRRAECGLLVWPWGFAHPIAEQVGYLHPATPMWAKPFKR